jgi:hypothetical protein
MSSYATLSLRNADYTGGRFARQRHKALLHFMGMLVSGALLPHRGALHPALKSIGLTDAAYRRAWAAFGYGAWTIQELLLKWRAHVTALPGWERRMYEGYHPRSVDLVPRGR